jgi:23S rRNA (guanosine2251-2'-O)-methyltransferase
MEILYGLHPVEEAVRAGSRTFDHVCLARDRVDAKVDRIAALCRERGIRVRLEPREHLTDLAKTASHQGVVAVVRAKALAELEELLEPIPGETPLLLALDGVEDPQNLGALLRTANGAGVHGVVSTERRAAPLSGVAAKASAGAAEHVRMARVVNMTRALQQIKAAGIWVLGLDERGTATYDQFDYTTPCALVLGREGAGLHDLVRRNCDHLLRIPMAGAIASLNVSVAGAVVLFEAARQRRIAAAALTLANDAAGEPSKPKKQKGLGSF